MTTPQPPPEPDWLLDCIVALLRRVVANPIWVTSQEHWECFLRSIETIIRIYEDRGKESP